MRNDWTIDPKHFDRLMVDIPQSAESRTGVDRIIDTGANTFSPLLAYLIANGAFDAIRDAGKKPIVHTNVGGDNGGWKSISGKQSCMSASRVESRPMLF